MLKAVKKAVTGSGCCLKSRIVGVVL